jgi:tetratricopeptide (TPR) repeat protein
MSVSTPASLAVGRFKQLPLRESDVWQGGIVRVPAWVEDPADPTRPYRPMGAMWVSLRTGRVHLDLAPEGRAATPDLALDVLLAFAKKETKLGAGRPGRLEVRDAGLHDALGTSLAGTGTTVAAVPHLPALDDALRSLAAAESDSEGPAGLLESPGITVGRLEAFASAAERFYTAGPWRHLVNEDLIVIEAPKAPKGMACVSVMGNGGQEFGLAFLESRKAFERLVTTRHPSSVSHAFGVTFGAIDALPFADADAWEDRALAVAGPLAYPFPADIDRDGLARRPSAKALTHMEGLLRALAESTEDDFDAGRWSRDVTTFDGPVQFILSLPQLLEAEAGPERGRRAVSPRAAERALARVQRVMADRQFESLDEANALLENLGQHGLFDGGAPRAGVGPAPSALEQAQDLVYDAEEAVGRRRIVLAKRALALSPDCADAYRLLGELAHASDDAVGWFQKGVEAGERAIGAQNFEPLAGHFWGSLETRPYMRARLALALALRDRGRHHEAIVHLQELLRLNPGDNQGVRYILLPLMLDENENDGATRLLDEYEDDASATLMYGRALGQFRATGDSVAARATLRAAQRANAHVPRYLLDPEEIPWSRPSYITPGDEGEAAETAEALVEAFEKTEGALMWLAEQTIGRRGGAGRRRARRRVN